MFRFLSFFLLLSHEHIQEPPLRVPQHYSPRRGGQGLSPGRQLASWGGWEAIFANRCGWQGPPSGSPETGYTTWDRPCHPDDLSLLAVTFVRHVCFSARSHHAHLQQQQEIYCMDSERREGEESQRRKLTEGERPRDICCSVRGGQALLLLPVGVTEEIVLGVNSLPATLLAVRATVQLPCSASLLPP